MFIAYLTELLRTAYKVPGEIDPQRSFLELDVDSLSLAELGAQLEDELGVTVEEEELSAVTTVAQLAALLEARGAVVPA
ncbi:acyl carrier protein [Streptomyces sp. NPDC094437]|uniref:acyl carrier protein n=1 Tax=Streptomyces sp. NPDC094437 TaxID=3366060 RepID=UPI0037F31683